MNIRTGKEESKEQKVAALNSTVIFKNKDLTKNILSYCSIGNIISSVRTCHLFARVSPDLISAQTDQFKVKNLPELLTLSSEELCKRGVADKEIALLILNHPKLLEKMGAYHKDRLHWVYEHSRSGLPSEAQVNIVSGDYLLRLANAHRSILKLIVTTPNLRERLEPNSANVLESSLKPNYMPI